jgi:hypothetical protein
MSLCPLTGSNFIKMDMDLTELFRLLHNFSDRKGSYDLFGLVFNRAILDGSFRNKRRAQSQRYGKGTL